MELLSGNSHFAALKPWPRKFGTFPSYQMVIFHNYVNVCQRVPGKKVILKIEGLLSSENLRSSFFSKIGEFEAGKRGEKYRAV